MFPICIYIYTSNAMTSEKSLNYVDIEIENYAYLCVLI